MHFRAYELKKWRRRKKRFPQRGHVEYPYASIETNKAGLITTATTSETQDSLKISKNRNDTGATPRKIASVHHPRRRIVLS